MLAGNRSAVAELTDTITGTIEQIELGEAVSRLADAAGSGLELAAEGAAAVGPPVAALGAGAARTTARNPAKVLGTIGVIVAIVALVYWFTHRSDDRPDPSAHPGVV